MKKEKLEKDIVFEEELCIPKYVSLREKYKCDKCRLNRNNVPTHHGFLKRLKYISSTCNGQPYRMTQCKKRCWVFSDLFSLVTAITIVIAFVCIFSHFQDLILSLAWTTIIAIGMDGICCLTEYVADKIFENIEELRRKIYDKKVADIEAINQEKVKQAKKQKEKEAEVYKDINTAKELFSSLANEIFDRLKETSNNSKMDKEREKVLCKDYKELLKNIDSLLEDINLDNFGFSEIKVLFQIHLPSLRELILIYIESIENEKETAEQLEELIKLVETFNTRVIRIQENLNNIDAENLIFKMQALRNTISRKNGKNDKEEME